ncbi:DUF2927 domain-containing protein [Jiulongibacter sp. NS-SX5]|uniref:DUF2927 domain-containing protein n=1 Tax=Jiulongibacter sp. NS-SX5 TaxID=3463854 RepID=UPI0040590941
MKKLILLGSFLILLQACRVKEEPSPNQLTTFQEETIAYFSDIALGFEYGNSSKITRKWAEPMRVYTSGYAEGHLYQELQKIISEINILTTDGFQVELVTDSLASNYHIYFGTARSYASIYPSQSNLVDANYGLFTVYWNANDNLRRGHMYVDTERADSRAQRHLLREELTQSLGLARDSKQYPESIFQADWTYTQTYAAIDQELIRLLYHPEVQSGLNQMQVEEKLTEILLTENQQ